MSGIERISLIITLFVYQLLSGTIKAVSENETRNEAPEKYDESDSTALLSFTGNINQVMHENMKREAKNLTSWAVKSYKKIHNQHPKSRDGEIFRKMLDSRVKFPGGKKDREIILDRYGTSLYGLCYYLGLNSELMKGMMINRCLQFTEYIDIELDKHGIEKLPDSQKIQYFKTLGLPEDAVNKSCLFPS